MDQRIGPGPNLGEPKRRRHSCLGDHGNKRGKYQNTGPFVSLETRRQLRRISKPGRTKPQAYLTCRGDHPKIVKLVPRNSPTNELAAYGPGSLSERCGEGGTSLTRRRRRRLVPYLIPSTTRTGHRGGTEHQSENCRVTTTERGLKFFDDRPLDPA